MVCAMSITGISIQYTTYDIMHTRNIYEIKN